MATGDNALEAHPRSTVRLLTLGQTDFEDALDAQHRLHAARVDGSVGDILLLTEHRRVLTLGRSADTRFIRVSPDVLAERGITVVRTQRGGDITYHGPGQLVAYPILDLRSRRCDIRSYVRLLEQTAIRMLAGYGIAGELRPAAPGVWVEGRKIASVGVYVRRWVTMHGIAINLEPDLDDFSLIHPCGLVDVEMTSVAAMRGSGGWMKHAWADFAMAFAEIFDVVLESTDRTGLAAAIASLPSPPPRLYSA